MRYVSLSLPVLACSLIVCSLAFPPGASAQSDGPTEDHPARATTEAAAGQPRYLETIRTEITAMGLRDGECEALDEQRGRCTFTVRGASTSREFSVHVMYSDRTDTVYMYVERYLSAPAAAPTTPAVLRRLMELNWSLLLGKFEWDPTDGEVRLAMILNTDSNFDRRAFRSAVRGIGQLADRYHAQLDRLAQAAD